ncbi:CoA transferase [Massilia niastensis]|uniref:CoA transferase n=1 Tax=Massilia niastensis TaxID=544911 RepID=UPI000A02F5DE|nr:CoA transferase [Massilia niastensis]
MTHQVLSGIRIPESGQLVAGPVAATSFAGSGAEVIEVETPGDGDPWLRERRRPFGPHRCGQGCRRGWALSGARRD